jgi:threonine/homoserine/homoserine lactone efflux protein
VFASWPLLQTVLKYAGTAYLVYLALSIARASPDTPHAAATGRPMTFFGAALFQWVNIKGWVVAIGTITAYAAIAIYPWNILALSALLLVIGASSSTIWVLFGTWLQPVVRSPNAVRIFNTVMALLLLASLYPVLAGA